MCQIWAAGAEKLNTHNLLTKLTPSRLRRWHPGGVVLALALPAGSSLRLFSDWFAAAIAYVYVAVRTAEWSLSSTEGA